MTITKVSFFVITAATADDPCDVGIYDANGVRLSSVIREAVNEYVADTGARPPFRGFRQT